MTNKNEKQIVEKIRNNYQEKTKEQTKLEELKALDRKVKTPARAFAYTYGTIGSLILGTGMTLAMKIIGASITALMPVGIVVGVLGIAMVSTTYPIYQKMLAKRKEKYADSIIEKSNELLNN